MGESAARAAEPPDRLIGRAYSPLFLAANHSRGDAPGWDDGGPLALRNTMKTLTVKIPEAVGDELRRKTKEPHEPPSAVVRRALMRDLESDAVDFAKLAKPYRGMFSGPADLSTREGYEIRSEEPG